MSETIKVMHLNNCIARIHMPEMNEEQKKEQMERFKLATAQFLSEVEREKQKLSNNKTA